MNKFKTLLISTTLLLATNALADVRPVVLTSYNEDGNYSTSGFNFVKMSHPSDKTGNRVQILFSRGEIRTETVVGDLGTIADLGERSCSDLPEGYLTKGTYPGKGHSGYPYAEDRKEDPMFWLSYSSAWSQLRDSRKSNTKPVVGHCYLTHLSGLDGVTVAMFRVVGLMPDQFIVISEMELFSKPDNK